MVAEAAGMARSTVQKAVAEVDAGVDATAAVRRPGAGRKRLIDKDPDPLLNLDDLVEPDSRGDPMCPLRWTSKSTGRIADALGAMGHQVSPDTVGRLLVSMEFSLQATAKQLEGAQDPDRDAQFVYLSHQVGDHLRAGQPVISVNTTRRRLSASGPTVAPNTSPRAAPSGWTCMTSPIPRFPRRFPSASMTWVPQFVGRLRPSPRRLCW